LFGTLMFILTIFLLGWLDIRFEDVSYLLPIVRTIALIISPVEIVMPWYLRSRPVAETKSDLIVINRDYTNYLRGLLLSFSPSAFGLFLYYLSAGLLEAMAYILASMIAMSMWARSELKPVDSLDDGR
jgi:hypothetical protein